MTESAANTPPEPKRRWRPPPRPLGPVGTWIVAAVLAAFVLNFWLAQRSLSEPPRVRIPYSPLFLDQVRDGNVESITSKGSSLQGVFMQAVRYPATGEDSRRAKRFSTLIPSFADTKALSTLLEENDVVINAEPLDRGAPWWQAVLLGFGPTLLFIGLIFFVLRRSGARGALGSFGRSRARRYQPSAQEVTFEDVAGIDEAESELTEIVDFLKNPERYRRLGGRIPRGVLLSGPPGTGKTLLARAVAGEAHVPFFSMSASEFIEAIVGVGASRVRDLFAQAKAASPAIVFIDELDAVGRSRSTGASGGGSDEREQTLNQILTEMDGFDPSTGVIVVASTNRPDILDPALLRPGRFDRRVAVQPPDRAGRRQILDVHMRGVPLAPDVDLERIAGSTPGMVGADLANLVNEAALLAARRAHEQVNADDFSDALEKVVLGAERKIMLGPGDRERTAYHEAGHAIVGMLSPGADPVRKVSIIPRGVALGVTLSTPEDDRFSYDEPYLRTLIKVALGGRAAEELVFEQLTSGAESDLQRLTAIARQMVGRWGMSPAIGPVTVIAQDGRGPFLPGAAAPSEQTQQLLDQEVRRIVDQSYEEVLALLRENRVRLDDLALALLEKETLDGADAYAAAGLQAPLRGDLTEGEVPAPV